MSRTIIRTRGFWSSVMEHTALIFKDQVGQYMARFPVKPTQKIITTRIKDNHLAANWELLNLLTNDKILMFVYTLLNGQCGIMVQSVIPTSSSRDKLYRANLTLLTKSNISSYMQNRTRSNLMRAPLVNINRRVSKVRVRVLREVRRRIYCVRQPIQPEQTIRTLGCWHASTTCTCQ